MVSACLSRRRPISCRIAEKNQASPPQGMDGLAEGNPREAIVFCKILMAEGAYDESGRATEGSPAGIPGCIIVLSFEEVPLGCGHRQKPLVVQVQMGSRDRPAAAVQER